MSDLAIGGLGFAVLFVLIALRVPIGVSMIAVGMVGYTAIAGIIPLMSFLKTEMYWRFSSFDFSVIPLFLMMGKVSLPQLRRYKYSGGFATGCLAAGGTLGALIPPSIPLIIYAIMVEGSIVDLFQGA